MTLETPLYQNKKGEWVAWEKLTEEDKKEIKRKEAKEIKSILNKEGRKSMPELVKLLSEITNVSEQEAKKELERLLNEK